MFLSLSNKEAFIFFLVREVFSYHSILKNMSYALLKNKMVCSTSQSHSCYTEQFLGFDIKITPAFQKCLLSFAFLAEMLMEIIQDTMGIHGAGQGDLLTSRYNTVSEAHFICSSIPTSQNSFQSVKCYSQAKFIVIIYRNVDQIC